MQDSVQKTTPSVLSVKNGEKTIELIQQGILDIAKHTPKKIYRILSKNDFGRRNRINVGVFNRKTNFIVSNENTLMLFDKMKNEIVNLSIDEAMKEFYRYFMVYPIPIVMMEKLDQVNKEITLIKNEKEETFILDYNLGRFLGNILGNYSVSGILYPGSNESSKIITDAVFMEEDEKIILNKEIFLNSNPEFLLGFIIGFTGEMQKVKFKNINIYSLTSILNLLGASYSIRQIEEDDETKFHLRFKIPNYFFNKYKDLVCEKQNEHTSNNDYYILKKISRMFRYHFIEDKEFGHEEGKLIFIDFARKLPFKLKTESNNSFFKGIKSEELILIPLKDLKFEEISEKDFNDINIYDFITEGREEATNYMFPFAPLQKNSDGDILACIALWTKDAAEQAEKKFGIKTKENVLNQLDGKVSSWIKNDAIQGLYEFTN